MRASAGTSLTLLCAATLVACGGGGDSGERELAQARKSELAVPKVAGCRGPGDRPETGLQGQVPAALRQSGFEGFNCNLELVGQFKDEGGNWSSASFTDASGRDCFYYATGYPTLANGTPTGRQRPGVPVIDVSDPANPVHMMSLTTPAMLDPWESLRVNPKRQLLVADAGRNSSQGDSTIDVYDLSGDCRSPQLLASIPVGTGVDGGVLAPVSPRGHEGNFAPDGLTYYIGDYANGLYHAVDLTNTTQPQLLATWDIKELGLGANAQSTTHGLSVSADGNRVYAVALGRPLPGELEDPNAPLRNGFVILDTSEVQERKPDARIRVVSKVMFKDGSVAQHTIPIKIAGKPYLVMVDEAGSAGSGSVPGGWQSACNAGYSPFPMARLYDISDEKNPVPVSKLMLETHDPKNCDQVLPDVAGLSIFTYGSHYCSVDNRENATALACSYFNSGIRVFDIRKPEKPKEIGYYNPPSAPALPGSAHAMFGQHRPGGPDWCASRLDFDHAKKRLTTMCQDNGMLVLQFGPGTWPFPQSTPSRDQS
jgi:hypothetical protein